MTIANQDEGLVHLAFTQGLLSQMRAQELLRLCGTRSMAVVLVEEGGLTPQQVRVLRTEQKRNSIPSRIGPYRLTSHLGNGGMSVVFKAVEVGSGRQVAVKLLSPRIAAHGLSLPRFERETRSATSLRHDRVIACLGHGEINGHPYQILEFMAGGDLAVMQARSGGKIPVKEALIIARDCAEGLAAVHAAGMVHRDIKPANIFLDAEGRAKIADLGLARHVEPDDQLTLPGQCVGTPRYMSPEQARAVEDIDGRTDVYSLAATLYHLITGYPPFAGQTPRAVLTAVVAGSAPDAGSLVPNLDPAVTALLARGMVTDRNRRCPDAARFAAEITAILCAGTDPTTVSRSPIRKRRWARFLRSTWSAFARRLHAVCVLIRRKRYDA